MKVFEKYDLSTIRFNNIECFDALIKYEKFLRKKREKIKEKIKNDLLVYNRDDLKRTKFIYDLLKAKS